MTLQRDRDGRWSLTCADCGHHLLGVTTLPSLLEHAERQGWHLPRLPGNVTVDLAAVHRCPGCRTAEGKP